MWPEVANIQDPRIWGVIRERSDKLAGLRLCVASEQEWQFWNVTIMFPLA